MLGERPSTSHCDLQPSEPRSHRSWLNIEPVDEDVFNSAHAVCGRDESCAEVGAMTRVKLGMEGGISGAERLAGSRV